MTAVETNESGAGIKRSREYMQSEEMVEIIEVGNFYTDEPTDATAVIDGDY